MSTTRGLCLAWICGVALTSSVPSARAQSDELEDAPRVFSIQPRPYRLGHEFQLGIGVLPLDAYYVGVVAFAGYTYHFSDFWGWEIAGAGYSANFSTGLKSQLSAKYGLTPVGDSAAQIKVMTATSLIIKPLFGKLAVFNSNTLYAETFFSLGLGWTNKGDSNYPAGALGIGLRFWLRQTVSIRLDVRDYLVFVKAAPDHVLLFMLSAALNYYDRPDGSGD